MQRKACRDDSPLAIPLVACATKLVAMTTSLDRWQPNFTAIITYDFYSPSVATICLSRAISQIWRDENISVATANKNWLPSLEGLKKITSDRSPIARGLQMLKIW